MLTSEARERRRADCGYPWIALSPIDGHRMERVGTTLITQDPPIMSWRSLAPSLRRLDGSRMASDSGLQRWDGVGILLTAPTHDIRNCRSVPATMRPAA